MQFHGRAEPAGETDDPGVGRNEPVDAELRQPFKLLLHQRKMFVKGKRVQTIVDADAGVVGKTYGVFQFFAVEAAAFCPQGQEASAEIHGIGSVEYRGLKLFPASGRGEQFR